MVPPYVKRDVFYVTGYNSPKSRRMHFPLDYMYTYTHVAMRLPPSAGEPASRPARQVRVRAKARTRARARVRASEASAQRAWVSRKGSGWG